MLLLIPTLSEAILLMGEAAAGPLAKGAPAQWSLAGRPVTAVICGFGLAAAGAGAGYWIGRLAGPNARARAFWASGASIPDPALAQNDKSNVNMSDNSNSNSNYNGKLSALVALVGLAGTFDPERAPVGSALVVTGAACDGIGVGAGLGSKGRQGAQDADWLQGHALDGAPGVGDAVTWPLPADRARRAGPARKGQALSVASASGSPDEAAARAIAWPQAAVEDMETFAVALAARLAGAPLLAVRGVSNRVGERDKALWRAPDAMAAARELLAALIE